VKIQKVLSLIPAELLESLALDSKVDHFTKKLQGEVIFKLLLHCIVSHKDNSLRVMQSAYESLIFKTINKKYHQGKISYSSISERLSAIKVSYFEKLYSNCVDLYKAHFSNEQVGYIRFDSTIVALSCKLLKVGYRINGGDAENYRQVKFTVGYSSIPELVSFYIEQTNSSENVSLKNTILTQSQKEKKRIKIFDRGISSRATYDEFTDNDIQFISRISPGAKRDIVKDTDTILPVETETLNIVNDHWCQLYGDKGKRPKHLVRCIEAVRKETGETLLFTTNIDSLSPEEITVLYKRRWDIEVFFKLLKQLLNFKHFINRSENGIKVVMYVTMIASILLIAYKKEYGINGYKIAKQQFTQELEMEIIKQLIQMCGGNPELLNDILSSNSS
jgi:hypothetical protein